QKVSFTEVSSNDYSLLVNRYVFEKPIIDVENQKQIRKFEDLITSILKDKSKVTSGKYIRIRDLSSDPINFRTTFDNLEIGEFKTINSYKLKPNVMLLATTWNDLKPTFYDGNAENLYYSYSDILAVELNNKLISPEYLVIEFH